MTAQNDTRDSGKVLPTSSNHGRLDVAIRYASLALWSVLALSIVLDFAGVLAVAPDASYLTKFTLAAIAAVGFQTHPLLDGSSEGGD